MMLNVSNAGMRFRPASGPIASKNVQGGKTGTVKARHRMLDAEAVGVFAHHVIPPTNLSWLGRTDAGKR